MKKVLVFILVTVFLLTSCDDVKEYMKWKQEQQSTNVESVDSNLYNTVWKTIWMGDEGLLKIDSRGYISIGYETEYAYKKFRYDFYSMLDLLTKTNYSFVYASSIEDIMNETPLTMPNVKVKNIVLPKNETNDYVIETDKFKLIVSVEVESVNDGELVVNSSIEMLQGDIKTNLASFAFTQSDRVVAGFEIFDNQLFERTSDSPADIPLDLSTTYVVPRGIVTYNGEYYGDNTLDKITEIVLPSSVVSIGYQAFRNYPNLEKVVIPYGVETIGQEAFCHCEKLKEIEFPESLKEIKFDAFYDCNSLKHVVIPSSVEIIGEQAFSSCSSLESVTFPEKSELKIGAGAFRGCDKLTRIEIPEGVESIGSSSFAYCTGLETVSLPNSIRVILSSAFENCINLSRINIPSSVEIIGTRAFECVPMEAIVNDSDARFDYVWFNRYDYDDSKYYEIPDGVEIIGSAFFCKPIVSVSIPSSVKIIGINAFCSSDLEDVTIPNGVKIIETGAFGFCRDLKTITLPTSIIALGNIVNYECESLTSIIYEGTMEQWNQIICEVGWFVPIICSDGIIE